MTLKLKGMSTCHKTGFSFYAIDTDRYQDRKIKRLKKFFGCSGIAVYDYLLCEIYRDKGCYMTWDNNILFDVAEYFDIEEKTVSDIVELCATIGLFDKRILDGNMVITSASIQRRYIEMCSKARRKGAMIPNDYLLIDETCNTHIPCVSTTPDTVPADMNPILSLQPVTLDDEIEQLMSEDSWLDQLQCIHSIDKGKMKQLLGKEFKSQCIADGKEMGHSCISDAKRHFNSWLRFYKERVENNGNQRDKYNQRRGSEVTATSAKDFEGSF